MGKTDDDDWKIGSGRIVKIFPRLHRSRHPHECDPPEAAQSVGFGDGSTWQCDFCGRTWTLVWMEKIDEPSRRIPVWR